MLSVVLFQFHSGEFKEEIVSEHGEIYFVNCFLYNFTFLCLINISIEAHMNIFFFSVRHYNFT